MFFFSLIWKTNKFYMILFLGIKEERIPNVGELQDMPPLHAPSTPHSNGQIGGQPPPNSTSPYPPPHPPFEAYHAVQGGTTVTGDILYDSINMSQPYSIGRFSIKLDM